MSAVATAADLKSTEPTAVSSTIALFKPDAVRRRIVGRIIREVEERSHLQIDRLNLTSFERDEAEEFYAAHLGREYFDPLVAFMTSGPLVAALLTGANAVVAWRNLIGHSDPAKRVPGTIRDRYAAGTSVENLVHGSDSIAAYLREYMQLKRWGCL